MVQPSYQTEKMSYSVGLIGRALESGAYLSDNIKVAQSGHVRVSPRVDSNIVVGFECSSEFSWVGEDMNTDHEVGS